MSDRIDPASAAAATRLHGRPREQGLSPALLLAATLFAAGLPVALAVPHDRALAAEPTSVPAGCGEFTWNLEREIELFAAPGQPLAAAVEPRGAPRVEPNRLYALSLAPQERVTFAAPPGKERLRDGARAGLVAVVVPTAGLWRVTIDDGAWIDVVRADVVVESNRFQGRSACPRFRKSVEYTLPAGETMLIQLSGGTDAEVRLAVTPVP
ncbi:MAG: hypothetical protein O9284_08145 [Steroidobacteraceae bacterium]|jgi:hypothetical protein|nr:hypothetical protein [Steroidobacteraceae bacterium]